MAILRMMRAQAERLRQSAGLNPRIKILFSPLRVGDCRTVEVGCDPNTLREVETYITELSIKEKMNDSLQGSLLKLSDDLEAKSHGVDDPEAVGRNRRN
jgi:hypothetical protein